MESKNKLRYINRQYGFILWIPFWWKRHCFIEYDIPFDDVEYSVNFKLRYRKPLRGKESTFVFSILVFDMMKKEWLKKYGDSPIELIAEHKGKVFSSLVPEEPPEEFLNIKTGDYERRLIEFKWLYHMENVEIGQIIKSIQFYES